MSDREILRALANEYARICDASEQNPRRVAWRKLNSLASPRPLIYVRAFGWKEMEESRLQCQDPLYRKIENFFRYQLFWYELGDDSVFEPWVTLDASYDCSGWGVDIPRQHSDTPNGSFKVDYPVKSAADLARLRMPYHQINELKTRLEAERLNEILGDIITVNVERSSAYSMFVSDLSTDLGYLRGIENLMLDMMDEPDLLHQLCSFMSKGVQQVHSQAEKCGDWSLTSHRNQAMPYSLELPDPAANVYKVKRKNLWCYMAAQEFTLVSPQQHEEFLLKYQIPIMEKFGLVAYGCCEDLSRKIDMLRQIPNLRRIAVSPFADVAKCAEQIGKDYVVSYRPSPADMVSNDWNEERINKILTRDLRELARNHCYFDITLKDVETVGGDPVRVKNWVKIVRNKITELI